MLSMAIRLAVSVTRPWYPEQGPIDYKLYEEHGGSLGKVVTGVLNRVAPLRAVLAVLTGVAVSRSITCALVEPRRRNWSAMWPSFSGLSWTSHGRVTATRVV